MFLVTENKDNLKSGLLHSVRKDDKYNVYISLGLQTISQYARQHQGHYHAYYFSYLYWGVNWTDVLRQHSAKGLRCYYASQWSGR
jgi:hypothetical protein